MAKYVDEDGREVSLEALCRSAPNWAANRIALGEAAEAGLRRRVAELEQDRDNAVRMSNAADKDRVRLHAEVERLRGENEQLVRRMKNILCGRHIKKGDLGTECILCAIEGHFANGCWGSSQ